MKQVLQNLKTGETEVAEVPKPSISPGHLLIQTKCSLISAGTERMLVEFGKSNLLQKARQQPDKVKQVLEKVKTDGIVPTLNSVKNKLGQPLPLGYSNAGEVIALGAGVSDYTIGDRVISNGHHAELVSVPRHLCARIPENVDYETASYTVLGAIALQGMRLAQPTLGESVAVIGLGLIGLLAIQLLKAQGCRVLASDYDPERVNLARDLGAQVVDLSQGEKLEHYAESFTAGQGMDAVLITASTKSSEPVSQAATICRKRGRIVLVGVTGLELSRSDFYEKELTFQVSCSYGPGRYDSAYEEKGMDYPIGFVRWTEQRNFQAVLETMSEGKLDTKVLSSHHFPISKAAMAYQVINGKDSSLGIVLTYNSQLLAADATEHTEAEKYQGMPHRATQNTLATPTGSCPPIAFIGAGNYASSVLIPAFKVARAPLYAVVSQKGVSAYHAARKYGIEHSLSTVDEIMDSPDIHAVVITTRHDSHADLIQHALKAGKHVFVEKPLCLKLDELVDIQNTYQAAQNTEGQPPMLMVGFNRRFAPHIQKIRSLLGRTNQAKSFIMTVNAGSIPSDHWTQDPDIGGGRIIGEGCHFIDLLCFLADSKIQSWQKLSMDGKHGDTVSISLAFENGSIATLHYFANGPKSFPKERLEIFAGNAVLQLDNFRKLKGYNWPGFSKMNLLNQDKGQRACVAAFLDSLAHGLSSPIPAEELFEVSTISIEIAGTEECF